MNLLISKLSGLRVLCGETINNCLPIHKIFAQQTEQNEDGEIEDKEENGDPFASTSMGRQNKIQNKQDEEEEEEQKHFKDDSSTANNSKYDESTSSNSFGGKDEYDIPFQSMSQMSQPTQSVFDNPVIAKPKAQKKPMLGMIDEDKIQKVEKNDPVDEVDYFSQMNMDMPAATGKPKAAKKQAKKVEVKADELFPEEPKESKFNMINDAVDVEEVEAAGWGDNVDDIDL